MNIGRRPTKSIALNDESAHAEALEILRGLIEKIVVRYDRPQFEIVLVGDIANMVEICSAAKASGQDQFRRSVKVVAGEGFGQYSQVSSAAIAISC